MVRVPKFDIILNGHSIDDLELRHSIERVEFEEEVGKFDQMVVDFVVTPELERAWELVEFGSVAELRGGYWNEAPMERMMLGFLSAVKPRFSERRVTITFAGYLKAMSSNPKSRQLNGKTIRQIVDVLLSAYPILVVGTIDNGDQIISGELAQGEQTDLQVLEYIANLFAMFIKIEPTPDPTKWALSMYQLGFGLPANTDQLLVMNPNADQQNPLEILHLREFEPEASILNSDVSVEVRSTNPIYSGYSELTPSLETVYDDTSVIAPFILPPGSPIPLAEAPVVVAAPVTIPGEITIPAIPPMELPPGRAGQEITPGNNLIALGISAFNTNLAGKSVTLGGQSHEEVVWTNEQHVAQVGTTVIFNCFGSPNMIILNEACDNEAAQRRILEAIQSSDGFAFVAAKSVVLNEGCPSLRLGQVRQLLINHFPLYGELFSGAYLITKTVHSWDRESSYLTRFDCNRNMLNFPAPAMMHDIIHDLPAPDLGDWIIPEVSNTIDPIAWMPMLPDATYVAPTTGLDMSAMSDGMAARRLSILQSMPGSPSLQNPLDILDSPFQSHTQVINPIPLLPRED